MLVVSDGVKAVGAVAVATRVLVAGCSHVDLMLMKAVRQQQQGNLFLNVLALVLYVHAGRNSLISLFTCLIAPTRTSFGLSCSVC